MRRKSQFRLHLVGLLAVMALCLPAAHAGLIYDNGAPNSLNANEMTQWIQAEDFTLAGATTLTDVRFWAVDVSDTGYQGSISWSIYADGAGAPGTLLSRGLAAPTPVFDHSTNFGSSYQIDFSLGSVNLGAGTYWLGLHNGPLSTTTDVRFGWETTAVNATVTGHEDIAPFDDGSWSNNGSEHAFQLYSDTPAVPVPGAVMLGTLGAGLVGWLRKRKSL